MNKIRSKKIIDQKEDRTNNGRSKSRFNPLIDNDANNIFDTLSPITEPSNGKQVPTSGSAFRRDRE